jgi:hypothetical protein
MPIARIDKAAGTRLRLNPKPQSQTPSGCCLQGLCCSRERQWGDPRSVIPESPTQCLRAHLRGVACQLQDAP